MTKHFLYPNPKKVNVVKDFLVPRFITDVWTFLGLIGYYRNFVCGYTKITMPFLT